MVGSLNLPHVGEGDLLGVMSCGPDRGLDSPDSGLPPSPSPSTWSLAVCAERSGGVIPVSEAEERVSLVPVLPTGSLRRLQPSSFGEGVALEPLPAREVRYTSSVLYDSDRHFIQTVSLQPRGQGLDHCGQTIVALSDSTWRHYKTQLDLQPRLRPHLFRSTTIVYPKRTSVAFATELSYDSHRTCKRFRSSVELEAVCRGVPPQ